MGYEDPIELAAGAGDQAKVTELLNENALPLFGVLDVDTFDKYMASEKGLIWCLYATKGKPLSVVRSENEGVMKKVAVKYKKKYHVIYVDVEQYQEAIEGMLGVDTYPCVVVQKKAGDSKRYVQFGDMSFDGVLRFMDSIESGMRQPFYKSESPPDDPIDQDGIIKVVSSTMKKHLLEPAGGKDVFLEVYAPWCGHCKKLEPEYANIAAKVKAEGLEGMIKFAKIDGTANDSPIETIEWTSFPTFFFIKAGNLEPMVYEGERTGKGMWRFLKKHATRADEIIRRVMARKKHKQKEEEL